MAIHSSILAWKNPTDRGAWWAAVHGVPKSRTWPSMHTGTAVLYPLEFYRTNLCLEIDKNYALWVLIIFVHITFKLPDEFGSIMICTLYSWRHFKVFRESYQISRKVLIFKFTTLSCTLYESKWTKKKKGTTSALCICRFCIFGFSQPWMENIWKKQCQRVLKTKFEFATNWKPCTQYLCYISYYFYIAVTSY